MNTEKLVDRFAQEQLLDHFAGIALASLIQKMPFLDIRGSRGEMVEAEELQRVKKELTGAAYEYACYMLITRGESIEWLQENEDKLYSYKPHPNQPTTK